MSKQTITYRDPKEPETGDIHVYPLKDILPHKLVDTDCHCDPSVEVEGAQLIIVHNSFDGREMNED